MQNTNMIMPIRRWHSNLHAATYNLSQRGHRNLDKEGTTINTARMRCRDCHENKVSGKFPKSIFSGLQKGPVKRCRAKIVESVEKLFDTFWRFLTFFALRENCRKVSKNFLTPIDDFWRFLTWPLSAGPFCNPLIFDFAWKCFSWFGGNFEK